MPTILPVSEPDDPRIEAYRDIRERDLVGRRGLFVAEGEVVLRHLVEGRRFRPVSVLIHSKHLARLGPVLARLGAEVPVFHAGQEVLDAIAGFPIHRGILGLGACDAPPAAASGSTRVASPGHR